MKRLSITMALVALVFVACGGGGGSSSGTTPASVETTGGGVLPSGFDAAQCTAAAEAMGAAAAAVPQALAGTGADIQGSIDALRAAAEAAPAEIKADMQTVSDGYAAFAQVLQDANLQPGQVPSAAVLQQLQTAAEQLNTDAFKAAVDSVTAWFRDNCGT